MQMKIISPAKFGLPLRKTEMTSLVVQGVSLKYYYVLLCGLQGYEMRTLYSSGVTTPGQLRAVPGLNLFLPGV